MSSPKCDTDDETKTHIHEENKTSSNTMKKHYDLYEVWEQTAKPDDILTRFKLELQYSGTKLIAHMIVDPVLPITRREVVFMLSEGFVELNQENVKRSKLNEKDKDLLIKSQFIDPEILEKKIKENLDKKLKKK